MLPRRSLSAVAALAFVTLVAGAGSSKAAPVDTIIGDSSTPSACAALVAGDAGVACPNGIMVNSAVPGAGGGTFTFTGYSGNPGTSTTTALTFKSTSAPESNVVGESGIGENASSTGACTDTLQAANCEIAGTTSVLLSDNNSNDPITDVVVGSVQSGENFQIWTGTTLADLAEFGSVIAGGSTACVAFDSTTGTCEIDNLPAGTLFVAVQSGGDGNVLLTAVSQAGNSVITTPEPASLVLLGTALVGFWMFRRRRGPTAARKSELQGTICRLSSPMPAATFRPTWP